MGKKFLSGMFFVIVVACGVFFYQKNKLTFSVIIPVYNSEKFLPKCLDSVLTQKGSFEVIAVNDGSTDNSPKILQEYAEKYANLKIINQQNQGVSAARNAGMAASGNKYITFLDSDDWFEPDVFEKVSSVIKKDNPDIVLAGFYDVYDHEWVRNTKGETAVSEVPEEAKFPSRKLDKLALFSPFYGKDAYSDLWYAGTGVRGQFFRRSFITKNNLKFSSEAKCGEDEIFVYRSIMNNPLISVLKTPLHNYRNRVDSLSKSQKIIIDSLSAADVLHQSPEYIKANRRMQMQMNDGLLFLTILGLSNLLRHGQTIDDGFEEAYRAYKYFDVYNEAERKSCRNLEELHRILFDYRSPAN